MKAVDEILGSNSTLDWGNKEMWWGNQPTELKMQPLRTPVPMAKLQPAIKLAHPSGNIAKRRPAKRKSPSTSRRKKPANPSPHPKELNLQPSAPKLNCPDIAPPTMAATATLNSNEVLCVIPPPPNYVSSMFNPNNILRVVLDCFDSLIAPLLPPPPNTSQSSLAIRRFLYRKQFTAEASALIQSSLVPIATVEQLEAIINSSCINLGFMLY